MSPTGVHQHSGGHIPRAREDLESRGTALMRILPPRIGHGPGLFPPGTLTLERENEMLRRQVQALTAAAELVYQTSELRYDPDTQTRTVEIGEEAYQRILAILDDLRPIDLPPNHPPPEETRSLRERPVPEIP